MQFSIFKAFNLKPLGAAAGAAIALVACMYAQHEPNGPQHSMPPTNTAGRNSAPQDLSQRNAVRALSNSFPAPADDALLAKGKALYASATYKCNTCHGDNGEGGDGPDLIGSLLDEDQIARFLEKPSAVAISQGNAAGPCEQS